VPQPDDGPRMGLLPQGATTAAPYGHQWYQANQAYQGPMAQSSDFSQGHGGPPVYLSYGPLSTVQSGHPGYDDGHFSHHPSRFPVAHQPLISGHRNGDM
jgi:hypothetical protein